jgi:hypothetical protein
MSHELSPMHQLLIDAGFKSGWALSEEKLILWEHNADPPLPLTRPKAQNDLAD